MGAELQGATQASKKGSMDCTTEQVRPEMDDTQQYEVTKAEDKSAFDVSIVLQCA